MISTAAELLCACAADRLIGLTAGFSSCPEMLRMIDFKVSSLIDHTKNLPPGLQDMAADILSRAQRQATDAVAKRTPLTHSSKTKTAAVKVTLAAVQKHHFQPYLTNTSRVASFPIVGIFLFS